MDFATLAEAMAYNNSAFGGRGIVRTASVPK